MSELSTQEAAVLGYVSENPFAGQQEIADQLGFARSTVAAHIVSLTRKGRILGRGYVLASSRQVVCVGGAVLDRKYRALAPLVPGTSNPAQGFHSFGGVARNVAETLAMLGVPTSFVSMVGDDQTGRHILGHLKDRGVDTSRVTVAVDRPTAEYGAVLSPEGDLAFGIADMSIFDALTPDLLDRASSHLASAAWVFADCNLPAETLAALLERSRNARFQLALDPVSTVKAQRLPASLEGVDLLFMNADEAGAYLGLPAATRIEDGLAAARRLQDRGARQAMVSLGTAGIALAGIEGAQAIPAVPAMAVDITGAGDAMIAGTLWHLLDGGELDRAARHGSLLAALTLETNGTVRADLSAALVAANLGRLDTGARNHGVPA